MSNTVARPNKFGLYDSAQNFSREERTAQISLETVKGMISKGAFFMSDSLAVEEGFLDPNAAIGSSEIIYARDTIEISEEEAKQLGLLGFDAKVNENVL
jgi:hypothetical protein